jgi:hypothetical protein
MAIIHLSGKKKRSQTGNPPIRYPELKAFVFVQTAGRPDGHGARRRFAQSITDEFPLKMRMAVTKRPLLHRDYDGFATLYDLNISLDEPIILARHECYPAACSAETGSLARRQKSSPKSRQRGGWRCGPPT